MRDPTEREACQSRREGPQSIRQGLRGGELEKFGDLLSAHQSIAYDYRSH